MGGGAYKLKNWAPFIKNNSFFVTKELPREDIVRLPQKEFLWYHALFVAIGGVDFGVIQAWASY